MIVWFGSIPFGIDHLTGPIGDEQDFRATFVEHDVTRGKPALQVVGEELDTRRLDFFFDEGFCVPEIQFALLMSAFRQKEAQPLIIPGAGYRGQRYVVESVKVKSKATTRLGRIVRMDATVSLLEAPRDVAGTSSISSAVAIGAAIVSALAPALLR